MHVSAHPPVEWLVSPELVPYETACAVMAARVEAIAAGDARELVWLLEHPPLYTAGTSARDSDLLDARFPVHHSGRGGQYTYHGPGQRVGYVMLDVGRRFGDVRAYVAALERLVIDALAELGVACETLDGRVGVWVRRQGRDAQASHAKIAAIGVRLRRWVSSHGFSVNVAPDLEHFSGIVPCGIADAEATSLAALGSDAGLDALDRALRAAFERNLGPTCEATTDPIAAIAEAAVPASKGHAPTPDRPGHRRTTTPRVS